MREHLPQVSRSIRSELKRRGMIVNTKSNARGTALRQLTVALVLACGLSSVANAQNGGGTAVLGNFQNVLVYPLISFPAGSCPANVPVNIVTGGAGQAHGVGFYGSDFALVSYFSASQIRNVQLSTGTVLNTISTTTIGYSGTGTIAVAPSLNFAIAATGSSVYVFQAPFTAPTATSTGIPGSVAGYQTQAVVFNAASRAFVSHSAGISVLDPPYTSVAFTIPGNFEAVAITPDGNTLLATNLDSNVSIFTGPFSAASTAVVRTFGTSLDGITVTPDGTRALVISASGTSPLYSMAAPFNATSVVDTIVLPAGLGSFEDISVSADGLYALLTGNNGGIGMGMVRGPFTTAGATACALPVTGGRGAGAVRFLPTALQPPVGPPPPAANVNVPTVDTYAMVAMAMLAALFGMFSLRRRRNGR
jgi:IPTL-CTERM motif